MKTQGTLLLALVLFSGISPLNAEEVATIYARKNLCCEDALRSDYFDLEGDPIKQTLSKFSGNLVVSQLEDIIPAKKLVAQYSKTEPLIVVDQSKKPAVGLAKLNSRPESITIVCDIPKTAKAFARIHGEDAVTSGAVDDEALVKLNSILDQNFCQKVLMPDPKIALVNLANLDGDPSVNLAKVIEAQSENGLVITVFHVVNGEFRLHDGSGIALAKLKGKGPIWEFGCNTNEFVPKTPGATVASGREISYSDAFEACKNVIKTFKEPNATLRDAAVELQNIKPAIADQAPISSIANGGAEKHVDVGPESKAEVPAKMKEETNLPAKGGGNEAKTAIGSFSCVLVEADRPVFEFKRVA